MADTTPRDPSGLGLQLRVGTFILVALAVFVGLIYGLGRQAGLFERQYQVVARFAQVGGLAEGATVRLAGVPVGRVTAIRLPPAGGARVEVELTLVRRVQDRIRTDSVARIETLGLLGDKIVEISLGSAEMAVLPDGARLPTEELLDTARLTEQGVGLLRNLSEISASVRDVLGRLGESGIGPDFVAAVRALTSVAVEIEQGRGLLHRLVYEPELGAAVASAAGAFDTVGEILVRLDQLLADSKMQGLAGELGETVAEARAAAARGNRILREIEEGDGLLHALIYEESRVVRDLDRLLARAGTLMASVERGKGALGILVRDERAGRATQRLVAAADSLGELVERARAGDGVLAALLLRPGGEALVADLREAARHFREVTARLARGEGVIGRLTRRESEDSAEQLMAGLADLGRLAGELTEDGQLGEALVDLREAMANLRAITARVRAGEGTIGGLVADPTVYENLAAFLEGAQRSFLLRTLIRSAIQRGASEP